MNTYLKILDALGSAALSILAAGATFVIVLSPLVVAALLAIWIASVLGVV